MSDRKDGLVGRPVRMVRAGSTVVVGDNIGMGGQGSVYRASLGGNSVAVKWLRPTQHTEGQRRTIESLAARERPHVAFKTWPIDVVDAPGTEGFGYVMPFLEPRWHTFASLLGGTWEPNFPTLIDVSRQLVDAFGALHASGLCYRDISFGNLRVDWEKLDIAVIDVDNVGVDGDPAYVKGTPRFMAPEVVRNEQLPSMVTDLFSLAVFLFYIFMHGHPLLGHKTEATYNWTGQHVSETDLANRHFGFEPVFVFDPTDTSNRPNPGDPMLLRWPIYPRFFRILFERSFTTGLNDATLAGRVLEGNWRRALVRLADCVAACPSCNAAVFWEPDGPQSPCWRCNTVLPPPPVLELPGHRVALVPGSVITGHHLRRSKDHRVPSGVVETDPEHPGDLILRNVCDFAWTVTPEGETPKTVGPNRRLRIRPMAIDFGGRAGSIRMP